MGKNFSCNQKTEKRNKSDFYQTPYSLTRLFLANKYIPKDVLILEPCCGDGAITKVLDELGYSHTSYDLEKDFLIETDTYEWIITNPPLLSV